jgi:Asp-tRNA(Asn)/Glu-tRNA(Gln) amidotransferase A subunit family amidase
MNDIMSQGLTNVSDVDLLGANVMDYARLYRSGAVQPSRAMQRSLAAVKAFELQGQRMFSFIDEGDVMRQAKASDERFAEGKPLSVFDGVPISIKDFIHVKGYNILSGRDPSRNWTSIVAVADDPIVSRFRDLGAIIFGLTVMTEGGMGNLGYNIHYQGCYNPYSSEHFPGGSSSGAVASVASGIVPVAIGVDAGGSIRTPSGLSGVHGLAATYGRVSASPSIVGRVLIKFGPMARTAVDLALAHMVLSAPTDVSETDFYRVMYDGNNKGPPSAQLNEFSMIDDLTGVRIGVFDDWSRDSSDEVYQANRQALDFLASRGATLVPVTIPHLRWQALSHVLRLNVDFALNWDAIASKGLLALEPSTRISYGLGSVVSALELAAIDRFKAWSFHYIKELFGHHNLSVIATPTSPILAPRLTVAEKSFGLSDSAVSVALLRYVFLANNLGLPSASVPIGFGKCPDTGANLPIGMLLNAWHWREDVLLRLAHAIDSGFRKNLTGKFQYPPLFSNPLKG